MVPGGHAGEFLADRHVLLVRGDHEAGVGEPVGLLADGGRDAGGAVAHRRHGDPGAEVDQGVPVNVDEHAAARGADEHRENMADPAGHAGLAAGQQLA